MSAPVPPVAIKISAQNEALKELEKARAEIVRLTETARRQLGQNFPTAARASTESVGRLRSGIQALAFQAAGIEGPIGKFSAALLTFGTGGLVTGVALAGIGAVALAMRAMVGPATEVKDAAEKLAKAFQGALSVGQQFRDLLKEIAEARAESAGRIAAVSGSSPLGPLLGLVGGARAGSELEAADIAAVEAARGFRGQRLGTADKEIQAAERATQLLGLEADQVAQLTAEWRGYTQQQTTRFVADARAREQRLQEIADRKAINELLLEGERIQGGINLPGIQAEIAGIPLGLPKAGEGIERAKEQAGLGFFKDAEKGGRALRELENALHASAEAAAAAALAHQRGAAAIIGAAFSLVRGGPGGFLSAAGGILGTGIKGLIPASPIAGAIVGGLGSLLGGGGPARVTIDGYTQRALDQQRRQEENKRNVVILQVVDAQGRVRDQIYDITRYQNRGGTAGGITARSEGGAVTTRSG
jgi:hypothetical protein